MRLTNFTGRCYAIESLDRRQLRVGIIAVIVLTAVMILLLSAVASYVSPNVYADVSSREKLSPVQTIRTIPVRLPAPSSDFDIRSPNEGPTEVIVTGADGRLAIRVSDSGNALYAGSIYDPVSDDTVYFSVEDLRPNRVVHLSLPMVMLGAENPLLTLHIGKSTR